MSGPVSRRSGTPRGFSLLELLVVLAILALLAGVVAPRVIGQLGKAKGQTASVQIENIKTALDMFLIDVGRYPTRDEGLDALVNPAGSMTGWAGPYLTDGVVPADPWGKAFRYAPAPDGNGVLVYTLGADDSPGGTGDNADIGRTGQ
ncbi:MAG: type II secretion system major pseudopilin GspG [Alphaproteobacteria bacterium]